MKKIFVLGIGVVIILGAVILAVLIRRNLKLNRLEANVFHVGYIYNIGERAIMLTNYDEFENYFSQLGNREWFSEIFERYQYDFFESKSLALVYVETASGSWQVRNVRAVKNDTEVRIRYRIRETWRMGTAAIEGYLIIVEVPESVSEIRVRNRN